MPKPQIVLLGLMSRMPVAGVVWQTVHYLVGLERLGYDVYYVEAHACTPCDFIATPDEDGSEKAAEFIAGVMRRFGFTDRWAFHALHHDGRCWGMSESRVRELYRSADVIINLHGGTVPLPEHSATGRLVYLESDPVEVQIELVTAPRKVSEYLAPHRAFFTFGENYGRPDCRLPVSVRFPFRATRQPVVMDFWHGADRPARDFTTIGNWRQAGREIHLNNDVYHWSKHLEFMKFLDLPQRTTQSFELALSAYEPADQQLLEKHGWRVRPAGALSGDIDIYRDYITGSRGEFTVAKDQNIRLRSGWFSDRAACYLAAGRPVITQETGFSNILPTGRGLFAFSTMDDILAAVEAINADYALHHAAAQEIAREYFGSDVVLQELLDNVAGANDDCIADPVPSDVSGQEL